MVASVVGAYGVAVGADELAFGYFGVDVAEGAGNFDHVGYFVLFCCAVDVVKLEGYEVVFGNFEAAVVAGSDFKFLGEHV